MKRKIILLSIIAILISTSFSGCLENNNQNQNNKGMITTSIIEYLITIEDLPEGFKEFYNGSDIQATSQFSRYPEDKPVEFYSIKFSKGSSSNESGYEIIECELNRFSSIEEAENAYTPTIEYIISEGEFEIIDGSINIIGNESKGITREGYRKFLTFRIYNVIGLVSSNTYTTTLELSEIVEERILASIN